MDSILVVIAILALVTTMAYFRYIFRFRRKGEAPYIPGHALWGNGKEFSQHAVRFLHKSQKTFGDIFTIRFFNQYLTMIMDPHAFEKFSKEKNFCWGPIISQVSRNVFGIDPKEPQKMISEAGKKVNGKYIGIGLTVFARNLSDTLESLKKQQDKVSSKLHSVQHDGLRHLMAITLFHSLFYSIFGTNRNGPQSDGMFNPEAMHTNFDIFHKVFNFLWLGLPLRLFPKASKAFGVLMSQPSAHEMLQRDDVSEYIKFSTTFMLERDLRPADIVGHNLVFMHVNYNTFRVNYWCVYHLLMHNDAKLALEKEMNDAFDLRKSPSTGKIALTQEDINQLPILDSFVQEAIRMASGVFVVRKVIEDTPFTMPDGKTFVVRQGDRVAMYPPATNMDPDVFENPEVFKYNRFLNATFFKYDKILKTPVFGFGSLCPGKRISILQTKWFLINYINVFSMQLLDGEWTEPDTKYYGHEIIPPSRDVRVQYTMKDNSPELVFSNRR